MPKTHVSSLDDSHDSGFGTEKENEETISQDSPISSASLRRQQFGKINFKSLTALSAKDSLENLQKIRRRNDGARRIFFNRSSSGSSEKRSRKKNKKRFDKSNVSEVNIRKVTDELVSDRNEKLVNVVKPKKLSGNSGKVSQQVNEIENSANLQLDENENIVYQVTSQSTDTSTNNNEKRSAEDNSNSCEILECLEKLRLGESNNVTKTSAQNLDEAKNVIDYSSGDVATLEFGLANESYVAGMAACAQIFDSKRRSVQWKHEVDVIYYAGDADGGKVVRRENEPLREEAEQQARRNRFIQLAITKNLLSNMSACQLRDPWLVVLPK